MALSEHWDDFEMLKNSVRWVREAAFKMQLRYGNRLNTIDGWHNVKILSISHTSRGELYVAVPPWWSEFKPARALAFPTPSVFAYDSSAMICAANADSPL